MRPPPRRVHQVLATLSHGDAISNEALAIQRHLRAAGFESDVFAETTHPRMSHLARRLGEYREVSGPDTVCLFHLAVGSAAGPLVFEAPDRLVLRYHNITPAGYFLGLQNHVVGLCYHGRRGLSAFAPRAELALGVSEFNRRELEAAGYAKTGVVPLTLDLDAFAAGPAAPVVRSVFADGRTNVLFVGRIIPNKKIEDLIRVFAFYQRTFDPSSRLLLVGDHWGYEPYLLFLQAMARELGAQEVLFTGQAEDDELRAYYSVGTVYVSMSEHEGFGVPLLEAMAFGMPVAAYDAAAVAETLAGAGVLLKDKRPDEVAPLLDRIVRDRGVREPIVAGQRRRLDEVRATDVGARLLAQLRPVLER